MIHLYCLLLWLYPRAFRAEYGHEMVDITARRLADAPSGWGRVRVLLHCCGDLVRSIPREWMDAVNGRRDGRRRREGRRGNRSGLLQDVRLAVRRFAKDPTFTAVAVLTLSLGIGATTAIFSVVNGVVLKPLAWDERGLCIL